LSAALCDAQLHKVYEVHEEQRDGARLMGVKEKSRNEWI